MKFGQSTWQTIIRGHGPRAQNAGQYLSHKVWTLRVEVCATIGCDDGNVWRLAKDGRWWRGTKDLTGALLDAYEDSTHIPVFMPKDKPDWINTGCKFFAPKPQ